MFISVANARIMWHIYSRQSKPLISVSLLHPRPCRIQRSRFNAARTQLHQVILQRTLSFQIMNSFWPYSLHRRETVRSIASFSLASQSFARLSKSQRWTSCGRIFRPTYQSSSYCLISMNWKPHMYDTKSNSLHARTSLTSSLVLQRQLPKIHCC
jgi:hypothetical protein